MLYLLLGFLLLFAFILSFGLGYVLGKGKLELPKRLTDDEKRRLKKQEEHFEQMRAEFNAKMREIMNYGDIYDE